MGLDMYLSQKHYVKNWDHFKDEDRWKITVRRGSNRRHAIPSKDISYITCEVGYWRKANQIHQWFVDNCQEGRDECQESYVSPEKLQELLDTVNLVLADHSLAEELLPSKSGFFFGTEDYDEYYYEQLVETKKILTKALKNTDGDFYYQSSW